MSGGFRKLRLVLEGTRGLGGEQAPGDLQDISS